MPNVRIPMAVCSAVVGVLNGSHATLNALFERAGAPGPPPDLAHHSKWKHWLFLAGKDPNVDSLAVLGNLIEEFMDLPPSPEGPKGDFYGTENPLEAYNRTRENLVRVLEENGFRYFRGGRVLPNGDVPLTSVGDTQTSKPIAGPQKPSSVEELIEVIVRGLPRAMHPFTHRRKGVQSLTFDSEYDIQDLLHSQLRPWIADIRPEEFTPSYAGSTTRMDFLLPVHRLVIEIKRVRDISHSSKVGNELIIDVEHYRQHPKCDRLWCVVYDPLHTLRNPASLTDLEGPRSTPGGSLDVRVFVISAP